ncbi:MAG: hypothetical protein LBC62_02505 [Treponema sp.]|jgi:hypothetical protein|nr:hypothetical protein [Treponema sp.]
MTKKAWQAFSAAREQYRSLVERLSMVPNLGAYQQKLVDSRSGPSYKVETPAVYNEALDEVTRDSSIKLILAADNPGRREQAAENRRYLVGPSGKIAEKFFRDNPEMGIDFRENVLILNKTPVHTPRTAELAELCRLGGKQVQAAVEESQRVMAELLFAFHRSLAPVPVWIIGYSEMKKGGVFERYTGCLRSLYKSFPKRRSELFLYRHFSMNQFTIDLNQQRRPGETTAETLNRIGAAYRERVLARSL